MWLRAPAAMLARSSRVLEWGVCAMAYGVRAGACCSRFELSPSWARGSSRGWYGNFTLLPLDWLDSTGWPWTHGGWVWVWVWPTFSSLSAWAGSAFGEWECVCAARERGGEGVWCGVGPVRRHRCRACVWGRRAPGDLRRRIFTVASGVGGCRRRPPSEGRRDVSSAKWRRHFYGRRCTTVRV